MDKHLQDLRHIDIEHHYIRCNEVSLAFFLNSEDQVVRFGGSMNTFLCHMDH